MPEEQPPKSTPQQQIVTLLEDFLGRAKDGKLANVAIAFTSIQGGADVYSSPMSPVSMCHLLKLFERRVNASYDRVIRAKEQAQQPPASPTGAMRTQQKAKVAAQLPRNVRRQVAKAQQKLQKQAAKVAKPPIIANQPLDKPL